jgi:anti-sigma factor RsiW
MKHDLQLQLQACLDGELPDPDRRAVEALLANDPSAAALLSELSRIRQALTQNEPAATLPESREFFWSKIERDILRSEKAAARQTPRVVPLAARIRRWLAPAIGVTAVLVTVGIATRTLPGFRLDYGLDTVADEESATMTFQDQSTGMAVVWIDYGENDPVEKPEASSAEDSLQAPI